jgi:RimJ/RimL family protein N-acetyltransferase
MHLRPIRTEDRDAWHRLVARNRAGLMQYFPQTLALNATPRLTRNAVRLYQQQSAAHQHHLLVLADVEPGELSGGVFLKDLDPVHLRAELAYFTDHRQEGRGLMTQAVRQTVDYAFKSLRLHRLIIKLTPMNVGSRRVAEKAGFELEGTLKLDYRMNSGEWVDVLTYGLVNLQHYPPTR